MADNLSSGLSSQSDPEAHTETGAAGADDGREEGGKLLLALMVRETVPESHQAPFLDPQKQTALVNFLAFWRAVGQEMKNITHEALHESFHGGVLGVRNIW